MFYLLKNIGYENLIGFGSKNPKKLKLLEFRSSSGCAKVNLCAWVLKQRSRHLEVA